MTCISKICKNTFFSSVHMFTEMYTWNEFPGTISLEQRLQQRTRSQRRRVRYHWLELWPTVANLRCIVGVWLLRLTGGWWRSSRSLSGVRLLSVRFISWSEIVNAMTLYLNCLNSLNQTKWHVTLKICNHNFSYTLLHWLKSTFEKQFQVGLHWIRGYDKKPEDKDDEFDCFVQRKLSSLRLWFCENLKKWYVREAWVFAT